MRFAIGLLVCLLFAGTHSVVGQCSNGPCLGCGDIYLGTVWPNGDLEPSPVPDIADENACCDACSANTDCKAFIFQDGACYLKDQINHPRDCMTCLGVNFEEPALDGKYNPDYGHDRYGGDIPVGGPNFEGVQDPNVCAQHCDENSECIAFVWRRDHRHCWLKKEQTELIDCPACVLGYKPT